VRRAAILLLAATADAGDDLTRALDAAARQNPDALAAIAKALDAGPSRDAAADAIAPAHWPVLARLAERPEGAAVVKRLLVLAYGPVAEPPPAAIPQADELARTAVLEAGHAKRFDACTLLARGYGERAVPCLLPYLRHQDTDVVVKAHLGLMRLGSAGVLPLSVAVRADGESRRLVARQLGASGDPRALAVLIELAEKDGPLSPAARAVAKLSANHPAWAADGTAVGAHVALARRYFERDAVSFPRGQPTLLWTLADDQLTSRLVDRHLFFIEHGKRAAEDALRLDPENPRALDLREQFDESARIAEKLVAESRR
jgi:hypothetical protein